MSAFGAGAVTIGTRYLVLVAVAAAIDVADVPFQLDLSRNDLDLLPGLGAHFVHPTAASLADLLVLRQFILDDLDRQVLGHLLPPAHGLGLSSVGDRLRLDNFRRRIQRRFGLVEDQLGLRKSRGILARRAELPMPRKPELLFEPVDLRFQILVFGFQVLDATYRCCSLSTRSCARVILATSTLTSKNPMPVR